MPFPSVCPHVQAEEAVSGSVWTSPLWLSHAQHILWGPFWVAGRCSYGCRNPFKKTFQSMTLHSHFPLLWRVIFSSPTSTVLSFLLGQLRNCKTRY